jgi:ribosome-associated toxin RatA of RatAB toxin-antitoxin module
MAAPGDLSPQDIARLNKGEQIKRVKTLKGQVWPEVTVITVIPNTPKENMDVFTDFESHKKFIPNLTKAKIVRKEGSETDVAFEMDMPMPLSNSSYTTRHTLVQSGEAYTLSWNLLKASQMKACKGSAKFEPYEGKTLFTYNNHITPDSKFAGMFKEKAKDDVVTTVNIIIKHLGKTIKPSVKN